jgi:hypothetical protein
MWFVEGRGRLMLWLVAVGVVVVAGASALAAMLGVLPAAEWVYTRWVAPAPPQIASTPDVLNGDERRAIDALGRQVRGHLVWSSNREGNHELYRVDLPGGSVRRLTNHPHVDFFSRFSPDGRFITFLRSQRPWVSFRETDAWDLYIMQADGAGERRLAGHAYHPTWLPDGSAVLFQRDNSIVQVDPMSGAEQLVYDGARLPTRGTLEEPELLEAGRYLVTLRGVRLGTVGILDIAANTYQPVSSVRACQITAVPGRREVLWMESGGEGGTRVMHADLSAPDHDPAVLIDLPGPYSHEYFPRITADGRWLVWGAAAEGHEHDRADYEIFVWERGTPPESAVRVTYSAANDQWPDLLLVP